MVTITDIARRLGRFLTAQKEIGKMFLKISRVLRKNPDFLRHNKHRLF